MGSDVEIHAAGVEHLGVVRELFTEYARSLSYHICFESFQKELEVLPAGYAVIFVAAAGGETAGCVAVRELSSGICEMKRLYLREQYRGSGAGRALVERAVAWAREQGYRVIRLDTLPDKMLPAVSLYRRLGFREIGRDGEKLDMELILAGDDLEVTAHRA
jgi:GNAT superfamily N-acetyltransferase